MYMQVLFLKVIMERCCSCCSQVTTVLLVAPVTLTVAKAVEMNAAPLLMTEVLFSNIGGTATQIGDPPNLIIGNVLSDYEQIGFIGFINHLLPPVLVVMCIAGVYCTYVFRNEVRQKYDPNSLTYVNEFSLLLVLFFLCYGSTNTFCSIHIHFTLHVRYTEG